MKSFLPGALVIVLAVAPGFAIGEDARATSNGRSETTELVHVQPRGQGYSPGSAKVEDVQREIDSFNAEQRAQDKMFDKKLTICRRC